MALTREQILSLRESISPQADYGGRGESSLSVAYITGGNPASTCGTPCFRIRDGGGTICFTEDPAILTELLKIEAAGYGYARELIHLGIYPKPGTITLEDLDLE